MRHCEICGQEMPQYNMFSNKGEFCYDCAGMLDEDPIESAPLPTQLKLVYGPDNSAAIHFKDYLNTEVTISEVPINQHANSCLDISAMRIDQNDAAYLAEVLQAFADYGYLPGKLNNNQRKG